MTEWYDEGEPPTRLIKFHEEDTNKAWSDIQPGDRIRWKTQTFVKRGTVIARDKRSMSVRFDAHDRDTIIPDCKWYFVEGKLGNMNEHLVTISTPAPEQSVVVQKLGNPEEYVSPREAAAILGTDQKNIRRKIRQGIIKAHREGGRWVIRRKDIT